MSAWSSHDSCTTPFKCMIDSWWWINQLVITTSPPVVGVSVCMDLSEIWCTALSAKDDGGWWATHRLVFYYYSCNCTSAIDTSATANKTTPKRLRKKERNKTKDDLGGEYSSWLESALTVSLFWILISVQMQDCRLLLVLAPWISTSTSSSHCFSVTNHMPCLHCNGVGVISLLTCQLTVRQLTGLGKTLVVVDASEFKWCSPLCTTTVPYPDHS